MNRTDLSILVVDDVNSMRVQVREILKSLGFTKVWVSASADDAGGAFDRTTMAAFNMAAAGFGSAESNAIALGKAMEDPIKGLTALRRSGTVFTEDQQKLIKSLVETGDVAGAQEVILAELESQYGGVAAATARAATRRSSSGASAR